ncbi:recombinase family protein, partial [Staphylococcus aureus]|nr:recombinase family protein [Staphylococcus aureus]
INAENLEKQVLESCQKFFRDQQLYSKIKHAIEKQLKKQKMHNTNNTLTHEKLIEKLAQGTIDVETFREQSQSINLQHKPIQPISD